MKFGLVKLVYTYVISLDCWLTRTHIVRAKFCERMDGFFCRRLPEGSSEHIHDILQDFGGQTDERRRKKKREFLPSSSSSRNTAKMRGKRAAHDSLHQPNISPPLFPSAKDGKKRILEVFLRCGKHYGYCETRPKKQGLNIFLSSFFRDICGIPFCRRRPPIFLCQICFLLCPNFGGSVFFFQCPGRLVLGREPKKIWGTVTQL